MIAQLIRPRKISRDDFIAFLSARKNRSIYLQPYPGNAGDDLIRQGSEILLQVLGIKQVADPERADIILIPCGNQTMWRSNLRIWEACWQRWPKAEFVIGPATFQGEQYPWRAMLAQSSANIAGLFARDPVSH